MNFLAHSYLSGTDRSIRIGNFIGDFVKGKDYNQYEEMIATGILLHREIDSFTDKHPIVSRSKKRISEKYGHYSGVIVDIFYDHFLAANWEDYKEYGLLEFTEEVYDSLLENQDILPNRVVHMLSYMIPQNWLYHYKSIKGIHQALSGLSRRTQFNSGMERASFDLEEQYDDFQSDFDSFFPDVHNFVVDYLSKNLNGK